MSSKRMAGDAISVDVKQAAQAPEGWGKALGIAVGNAIGATEANARFGASRCREQAINGDISAALTCRQAAKDQATAERQKRAIARPGAFDYSSRY